MSIHATYFHGPEGLYLIGAYFVRVVYRTYHPDMATIRVTTLLRMVRAVSQKRKVLLSSKLKLFVIVVIKLINTQVLIAYDLSRTSFGLSWTTFKEIILDNGPERAEIYRK